MAYFCQLCETEGLPQSIASALLKSINPSTLRTYKRFWKNFAEWVNARRPSSHFSAILVCEYLHFKFAEGFSTSTLNSIKSALSFFTSSSFDLENNKFLKRLFKFFYQLRPFKPKYTTFWPVEKVLALLRSWHPLEDLSLKLLTLKTIALMALSSSDRGQTLHLAKISQMISDEEGVHFVVKERTKSTRKVLRPIVINCVSSSMPELDVAHCVNFYVNSTTEFRINDIDQLFISWRTKLPVTRQTLARWLKLTLQMAGIDTSIFTAHSFRGAGLSHAYTKGTPINKIVAAGNWRNAETFRKYYCAPADDSPIGNIILNN